MTREIEQLAIREAEAANRRAEIAEAEANRLRAALAKIEMAALVDVAADMMERNTARIACYDIARAALRVTP